MHRRIVELRIPPPSKPVCQATRLTCVLLRGFAGVTARPARAILRTAPCQECCPATAQSTVVAPTCKKRNSGLERLYRRPEAPWGWSPKLPLNRGWVAFSGAGVASPNCHSTLFGSDFLAPAGCKPKMPLNPVWVAFSGAGGWSPTVPVNRGWVAFSGAGGLQVQHALNPVWVAFSGAGGWSLKVPLKGGIFGRRGGGAPKCH
jgi:hypothetical protein